MPNELGLTADEIELENWASLLTSSDSRRPVPEPSREIRVLVAEAIHQLAERPCELIATDNTALRYVEWRHLELVVATALEGIGFEVELTPPSKDGEKDVVASCTLKGERHTFFIEIKHWRSGKKVASSKIMDFVEVAVRSHGGLFLSTSGFSDEVFTHLAELDARRVYLGGSSKIVSLCQHYTRQGTGIWLARSALPAVLFENTTKHSRYPK